MTATSVGMSMQSRYRGCLLGLAVGDALGGPVEFMTRQAILTKYGKPLREMVGGGWLKLKPGETTDDTAMARALAESIVLKGHVETADVASHYLRWMQSNPPDIGNITRAALRGFRAGLMVPNAALGAHRQLKGKSAGNGTIMRCPPVALRYAYDERRLIDLSRDEALITHFDPLAWTSSVALNMLIARALHGKALGEAIKDVAYRLHRIPKAAREVAEVLETARGDVDGRLLPTTGYVLDTLRLVLWALLGHTSFEEALVAAVNQGGDADTQGAVVGALGGALYGYEAIPARWLDALVGRDELLALADHLLALAEQRRVVV
jgi:ADP-ribosyl-[dinitrogen reductase] hydrolase